jgi:hypothetical protein
MNKDAKRKPTVPAHDNPIIAAVRRSLPGSGSSTLDPTDPMVDLLIAVRFYAPSYEIGVLVFKALLTGDRQIVRTVKDALRESDHIFRRDLELVLRKEVAKYLPELIGSGLDIVAIKREIEKRSNCGNELPPHRWNRLRKALCLAKLPTGRPRKVRHETAKSVY